MVVPAGMLQFPVYSAYNPAMYRFQTFGSAGLRFARAYIYSIDEVGCYYNQFGDSVQAWWTQATYDNYVPMKQCVIDAYRGISTDPLTINGNVENAEAYARKAIVEC